MNVDWYSYYHHLIHLSNSSEVTATTATTGIHPPALSVHIPTGKDKENELTRTRSRSRAASVYSENGTSAYSPMRRKYSKAEHWFEILNPEIEDEGYQFVAILSREQCQEVRGIE